MQPNANTSETLLPRAVLRQMQGVADRLAERSAAAQAPAPVQTEGAAAPTSPTEPPGAASNAAPVFPASPAPSAPQSSTADARENSVDYWRERFSVMQGVNAKLRRDHADAIEVRDREVNELRSRLSALEQASRSAPASNELDLSLFFKPEQIERFGEEQCEAMARAAIAAAGQQAQHILDAEVKPIKERQQQAESDKVKAKQEAFWKDIETLLNKIPEAGNRTIWEINDEQPWREFLEEQDADGEVRQTALTRHQRNLNSQGVVNLVRQYLKKANPMPPAPPVAPGGGSGGEGNQPNAPGVNGKGYPSKEEFSDYSKRAATVRNPRDPRFVTSKEREEMEARLRLPRPGGR